MNETIQILDIEELKSIEVDDYCDLCVGLYNGNYIVYVDSGDTYVEESEIFYNGKSKNKAKEVLGNVKDTLC